MPDPIENAARGLTADEATILAHYANAENASDIAITLEMDRNAVIQVIRDKGRDNRTYARGVATKWKEMYRPKVSAARQVIGRVVDGHGDVFGTSYGQPVQVVQQPRRGAAMTYLNDRTPPPVTPKRAPTKKTPAAKNVAPAQPAAPAAEQEETPPVPTALPQTDPADVKPADQDAHRVPDAEPDEVTVLPPDIPTDPYNDPDRIEAPQVVPVPDVPDTPPDMPVLSGTAEQLLQRAETSAHEKVQEIAAQLRRQMAELDKALATSQQADMLVERIAILDTQIEEKTRLRDDLRRQLEELWNSDVVVSATSGTVRGKAGSMDPDNAIIRAWGIEQGYQLAPRGSLPNAVVLHYRREHDLP